MSQQDRGEVILKIAEPPPARRCGRNGGRRPVADWDKVRSFVAEANGEWCQVMAVAAEKGATSRLRMRAKRHLSDFESQTRVEGERAVLYARAKGEECDGRRAA